MSSAPHPTPREAWNSLGQMSREEAMSAYITEMKLVAQKVIDTVPLGEVAEDMFGYFEPLYQVIPDMPRPPETFLRRVTGWKEQVLNGDAEAAPEPPCLPKEPAPPSLESQPPRDQDSEVSCDSVEQLEPELVGEEQRGALGGENDTRNSPEPPAEKGRLEGPLLGPQELDSWLVGTVRALQESMRDVQGRLQSLESMPMPPEQVSPFRRSRARLGQNFEGLCAALLSQPLLCPPVSTCPHFCLLQRMVWLMGQARKSGGLKCFLPGRESGRSPPFLLLTPPRARRETEDRGNSNSWRGQNLSALCTGAGRGSLLALCQDFFCSQTYCLPLPSPHIQPLHPSLLLPTSRSACP
ncbi:acyl-CoA-binding domain-containing protein 4 isoform X3 [Bos javanicus]|uniref:acyl-CoA-binding domain-containing protein 4 isoform X3 n=1 Tax=Bos javanicus TaxID=9906 RepID=UPI002AA77469|nr:acyl-CoA-binding domain-containing protein 4 isoform X3 [Bos javanicus]